MPTYTTEHHRWPHLPAAPWRYTGHTREVYQAVPGDPNCPLQPGGSCDHCSTGIYEHHHFVGADGARFKVGSDCVRSMIVQIAADQRDAKIPASLRAAERAVKNARNAAARERSAAKRERAAVARRDAKAAARALLEARRDLAAAQPHPLAWRAERGDTLADWAQWMLDNGGAPACAQVVAALEALGA